MNIQMGQKCAIRECVLGSDELKAHLVGIGLEDAMNGPDGEILHGLFDVVGVDISPSISGLPEKGNLGHNENCSHLVYIQQDQDNLMEFPLAWVRLF